MNRPNIALGLRFVALVVASLVVRSVGAAANSARESWPTEANYVTLPSPTAARFLSVGYNQLMADITWSRLLVYYDNGAGDSRYLGKFIDNIIALDPHFRRLYEWSMYAVTVKNSRISIDMDDIWQSIHIAEKAIEVFPQDYEFYKVAGYHYFLDLKSDDPAQQRKWKEIGADYIERATDMPNAPRDFANRAAGLRGLLGQHEQARANLMQAILTTDDPQVQADMLRNFSGYADEDLAEELNRATVELVRLRGDQRPWVPANLFILMGGPPVDSVIQLQDLATERDLFGIETDDIKLF